MIEQSRIENQQAIQQMEMEKIDVRKYLTSICPPKSQPGPGVFQGNNNDTKIRKKSHSTTKVKVRSFLTNASYRRHKPDDFQKANLMINTVSFLVQNLSPMALDGKLETDTERSHVKLIWDKCLPTDFTSVIPREKNFLILTETQITYQNSK